MILFVTKQIFYSMTILPKKLRKPLIDSSYLLSARWAWVYFFLSTTNPLFSTLYTMQCASIVTNQR